TRWGAYCPQGQVDLEAHLDGSPAWFHSRLHRRAAASAKMSDLDATPSPARSRTQPPTSSSLSWKAAAEASPQECAYLGIARKRIDLRNDKINPKVREHSLAKVPVLLVAGARRPPSIRRLGKEGQTVLPLEAALKALADEAVPPDLKRGSLS